MPALSEKEQARMKAEKQEVCTECGVPTHRNYCRSCDEYFEDGHTLVCNDMMAQDARRHSECRTH
ncbi:MAG: hypothetical protein WC663_05430 [Patescibacteria group bacterium]|jgi:hypothetical protein